MNEHVPLELGVVEKSLTTALVRTLKELISVNSVVFLQ